MGQGAIFVLLSGKWAEFGKVFPSRAAAGQGAGKARSGILWFLGTRALQGSAKGHFPHVPKIPGELSTLEASEIVESRFGLEKPLFHSLFPQVLQWFNTSGWNKRWTSIKTREFSLLESLPGLQFPGALSHV